MITLDVTSQQLGLLHHALGVTPDRREPFRNHFVAGPGHYAQIDLEALEGFGLMARGRTPAFCDPDDVVFHCTAAGQAYALENLPFPPPAAQRSKYDDYLAADSSLTFPEWLGINLPREQYYGGEYRYSRFSGFGTITVTGEWKPTKKEAKASYKSALRKQQTECRA